MNYTLHFLPKVEEDVIGGYLWYESKSLGLGEDFLRIFYASSIELTQNPLLYPKVYGDFRRRLLRRFPYAIYYIIEDSKIIIFGLFHCARDPRSLKKGLRERKE